MRRTEHPRPAAALLAALAVAATLAASPAASQQAFERKPRLRKVVGVAAFRNYYVAPGDVFRRKDALAYDDALHRSLEYVQERLTRRPDIDLVTDRTLRERISSQRSYQEGILLAREWFNLGVDHYRALRLDRALENLDRAEKLYLDIHQDLVEPFALAELELYRGLALSEKGATDLAHVAFKQMFAFNPWQRFRRGYYAAATEKAIQAALVDFQLTTNRDMLYFTPERIDRFLEEQGLDSLLFGYVDRRDDGGAELHVVVYERAPGRVAFRDVAPLAGDPTDIDSVDRLLTRWLACADWRHREEPRTPLDARVFLDVGISYSFFLVQPLRQLFHSVGLRTTVAWQLTQSFDLHGTFAVKTTFPDPNKDLIESSTTFRGLIGAGFTFRSRRLRYYIHPGVDILYVGPMRWTTNAFCKFYADFDPAERRFCAPGDIDSLPSSYLLGLGVATGLDVFLTTDLYLDIRAESSAYFVPFAATDTLNFPLDFSLAVGYAF